MIDAGNGVILLLSANYFLLMMKNADISRAAVRPPIKAMVQMDNVT